jgi:NADH-quinone oxidoreductase subunit N
VDDWRPAVWALAIASTVVGSVMAVSQTNVKRMLAYSSVSHAGFILVGVEASGHRGVDGLASTATYLVAYSVMSVGSFAVVMLLAGASDDATSLAAFKGLARRRPSLALAFTVLLLAQAGVPFTSGFVAKFGVIRSAVEARSWALAIVAMVAAVVAAFVYLRIIVSMWLEEPDDDSRPVLAVGPVIVVALAVAFTLVVGLLPGWLLNATESVARAFG